MKAPKKVIEKVKKLLARAKGKGSTLDEMRMAMEKASAIMLEWNLQEGDLETQIKVGYGDFYGVQDKHLVFLAKAAGLLYGCLPMFTSNETDQTFRFVGREENVSAAQATYEFFVEEVRALGELLRPKKLGGLAEYEKYLERFYGTCSVRIFYEATRTVECLKPQSNALVPYQEIKLLENEALQFAQGSGEVIERGTANFLVNPEGPGAGLGWKAGGLVKLHKEIE